MTVSTDSEVTVPGVAEANADVGAEPPAVEDFDLDIRFAESGPIVEELMRPTDDGCGQTCESACMQTCP
ncbi:FxLD family lanthipeptide [Actinopolyspora saharensis]|uniref:FxLD family lantipeptide n=1 Tax=Actinopolyspora saharensis TaxID=995062 RepID=A0A1H0YH91_9ACTN|nr:FxLD family lanthipeptide [Actinopolyspora saharensis]SDQ14400.1 FxLD family lantipeptide [Actinopolyspora saharensis]